MNIKDSTNWLEFWFFYHVFIFGSSGGRCIAFQLYYYAFYHSDFILICYFVMQAN